MKIAFIPPVGQEVFLEQSVGVQMGLAIPELDYKQYKVRMNTVRRRGDLIIVDNGANEGSRASDNDLLRTAIGLGADEICLPDSLGNCDTTLRMVHDFLLGPAKMCAPTTAFMAIIQAQSWQEVERVVDRYAAAERITTIGIPRDTATRLNQSSVRLNIATHIEQHYPGRFSIHFLGAVTAWVKEPYYVAKYAPFVRSIDTSLPFNAAFAGIDLEKVAKAQAANIKVNPVVRPSDYFKSVQEMNTLLAQHNINTLRRWAIGTQTSTGEVQRVSTL